eukprot:CAMPEP_0182424934 /NCGR_PEP_ID=MMETSP1167-20130531/11240_1 /TAXON_ID=2988 /ORGANISM="Mallomonas Sp, Strain CCMP3275" /LENGTH=221 /DNA_ID=CAMNT_0024605151 /DNA_START=15 /DNA_END=677 /DNA_ORIENTATION=+
MTHDHISVTEASVALALRILKYLPVKHPSLIAQVEKPTKKKSNSSKSSAGKSDAVKKAERQREKEQETETETETEVPRVVQLDDKDGLTETEKEIEREKEIETEKEKETSHEIRGAEKVVAGSSGSVSGSVEESGDGTETKTEETQESPVVEVEYEPEPFLRGQAAKLFIQSLVLCLMRAQNTPTHTDMLSLAADTLSLFISESIDYSGVEKIIDLRAELL